MILREAYTESFTRHTVVMTVALILTRKQYTVWLRCEAAEKLSKSEDGSSLH